MHCTWKIERKYTYKYMYMIRSHCAVAAGGCNSLSVGSASPAECCLVPSTNKSRKLNDYTLLLLQIITIAHAYNPSAHAHAHPLHNTQAAKG